MLLISNPKKKGGVSITYHLEGRGGGIFCKLTAKPVFDLQEGSKKGKLRLARAATN